MKHVPLSAIQFDSATQVRAEINAELVNAYAAELQTDAKFPPVDLFSDGTVYFIGDGWHRLLAAQKNGDVTFPANVFEVGATARKEAIKFALSANSRHGLMRSNADKRRAVEVGLREFPNLSDSELCRICAVSDKTVASVRDALVSLSEIPKGEKRMGADGRLYNATKPERMKHEPRGESDPTGGGAKKPEPPVGGTLAEIEAESKAMRAGQPAAVKSSFDASAWQDTAQRLVEFRLSEVPADQRQAAKNFLVGVIDAF